MLKGVSKIIVFPVIAAASALLIQCGGTRELPDYTPEEVIYTHRDAEGVAVNINFLKGREHNHPLMAIWVEDPEGNYIETLYVAESIGKGVFRHGNRSGGKWEPGAIRRPAALPYWGHKRGIQASDGYYIPEPENPVPDAITGPTPQGSFLLDSKVPDFSGERFNILLELNQSWDWNEFWTNNKFPGDEHYKTSSQPAVVYQAEIDLSDEKYLYEMKPIGHSHYAGASGELFEDLSTITTGLEIAEKITVREIRE